MRQRENSAARAGSALLGAMLLLMAMTGTAVSGGSDFTTTAATTAIDDPSSTFAIGGNSYFEPGQTVQMPVTLTTSSLVNYFSCRIAWDETRLQLVQVLEGSGLPAGSGSFTTHDQSASQVGFTFDTAELPPIAMAAPVAVLEFVVLCADSYGLTGVSFWGGTDFNYFNDEFGSSLGPNLASRTVSMNIRLALYRGSHVESWPNQLINHSVDFYTSWPGRPEQVIVHYDFNRLTLEGWAKGDALGIDDDVTVNVTLPGTLIANFDTAVLAEDVYQEILKLDFRTSPDFDDYESILTIDPASTSLDLCDDPNLPTYGQNGSSTVADHLAAVELDDINVYPTATYYDVPFIFDSTFPVDDYLFRVSFDSDLSFVGPVGVGDFAVPDVTSNASELTIFAGENPDPGEDDLYVPAEMPTTVFLLRFAAPTPAPSPGTTYSLTFFDTADPDHTYVSYDITPTQDSDADISFLDATIQVVSVPQPPTCPTLFVWDGGQFARENTLLAACGSGEFTDDVTDFYRIATSPALQGNELRFQIREDDVATSQFRDFELMAVDHPLATDIRVGVDGTVVELGTPYQLKWARDDQGKDITDLLVSEDQFVFERRGAGWIEASFGRVRSRDDGSVMSLSTDRPPKDDRRLLTKGESAIEPGPVAIAVQVDGSWIELGNSHPRFAGGRDAILMAADLLEPGEELVLRYAWEVAYRVDVLELQTTRPLAVPARTLRVASLTHNAEGDVLGHLGKSADAVWLRPGELLELRFDTAALPELEDGMAREYVLVSTGHYGKEGRGDAPATAVSHSLSANTPNPFNPSTTIKYSLPEAAQVELRVLDARGQLVRTLIAGIQSRGENSVTWDGRSDDGVPVASGVYFYRLDTPGFSDTQKMVLLK